MGNNKVLRLIGLATKAGNIVIGTDPVKDYIKRGKGKLVIIATDISEKTKEDLKILCSKRNIPIYIYSNMEDISKSMGKNGVGVICLKDKNLSIEIEKNINGGEIIG